MYIVLDIGGTFVKYAVMDGEGHIAEKGKKPSGTDLSSFQEVLFSIVEAQNLDVIQGIAISCPGTIDTETGTVYHGGSFPFLHEVNLGRMLEERYGKPAAIENDGKCAALAELWLGSLQEAKDGVVLVLGSGVGGGIIIDRKLHRGVHLSAGEVSYVMSQVNLKTREAHHAGMDCSAVRMVQRIAELKGLADKHDGEAVFALIQRDEEAAAIFDEYCLQLAVQIYNLQYVLDPEVFAIGGGISAQPLVLERIQWALAELRAANPLLRTADPKVVSCTFRNDANLYGALYHLLQSSCACISRP
ncbi:ROK family protein [Ectobacillus ponti]|uniref:ROK family protein n=1 Tax=Ectobacillus ponti TaxID=2961894 RepID=A0AA41X349_9BACI|nr:ROK family protein [Ectobacillus ponti]MCP8967742.1 ROK family protein [Ectobacillus ponti]